MRITYSFSPKKEILRFSLGLTPVNLFKTDLVTSKGNCLTL